MAFLKSLDFFLFHYINGIMQYPVLDVVLPTIRNANTWIPLYIFLAGFTIYKYRQTSWIYIVCIVLAFGCTDLINHEILKPFFSRLRPCHTADLQVRLVLGHCGGLWSFPSSHAANHMAMALTIIGLPIFHRPWIKALWVCWALAIGYAQIYVGVHFPSDILGGFILGTLMALLLLKWVYPLLVQVQNKYQQPK